MKRFLIILLLLFPLVALAEDVLPMVWSTILPATDKQLPNYADDQDYNNFIGRLYVDDLGIDVALYYSND